MAETVVIPRRFNGPPDSGHGGYSAGLAAKLLGHPAEVALRAPPPLDRPLTVRRGDDGGLALSDEGATVIEARRVELDVEAPPPLSLDAAAAGSQAFHWGEWHPFPTCFGCGPERASGDGLRLFAGPVGGGAMYGTPWTPAKEFADAAGTVDPLFVWAALDCPTGAAGANDPRERKPVVLASLAVDVLEPVAAGEPHAIGSWRITTDGRKRFVGVALWDVGGSLRALGRALWIELRQGA